MKSEIPLHLRRRSSNDRWTIVLALLGLSFALLLGGLSVWFLGSVAIAGLSLTALTFNFHVPAALIRLCAVGRTSARYGERLLGHKAALSDQVIRRARLFTAMAEAPTARRAGWQLARADRLADYLDDVEALDFARLRVDLPALTVAAGLIVCTLATLAIAPMALLPLVVLCAIIMLLAQWTIQLGATQWPRVRALRGSGSSKLGSVLASVWALKAEAAWAKTCGEAVDEFSRADRKQLSWRRSQAVIDAAAAMLGPAMALSVMLAAVARGGRGEHLLIPAFLAFAWLVLSEPMHGLSRILVAHVRRLKAQLDMARWLEPKPDVIPPVVPSTGALLSISFAGLPRLSVAGNQIGWPLDATFRAGFPTVLLGPSGCGKTSLLKQIAGWLGDDMIAGSTGPLCPAKRQQKSCFVHHDAAILSDTVRANLFAAGLVDEELWRALTAVEMAERISRAGGLDAWVGQDVLSTGESQRINLARAWLSDKPIVLLDEPTEHLDGLQSVRILNRLLDRLRDRIVIFSSHRDLARLDAVTIAL
jgi:ABC-type transport system involved in cytochrome bd biosynthesis fused ATPase/permease subunit